MVVSSNSGGHVGPRVRQDRPAHGAGARLQQWRLTLGLTQAELGAVLGVGSPHISRMERGHVSVSGRVLDFCAAIHATRPLGHAVGEALRTRGSLVALALLLQPLLGGRAAEAAEAVARGTGPSYAEAMAAARKVGPGGGRRGELVFFAPPPVGYGEEMRGEDGPPFEAAEDEDGADLRPPWLRKERA